MTNFKAFTDAIVKAKPSGAKGKYVRKISLTTTMGPGLKIDHRGGRGRVSTLLLARDHQGAGGAIRRPFLLASALRGRAWSITRVDVQLRTDHVAESPDEAAVVPHLVARPAETSPPLRAMI